MSEYIGLGFAALITVSGFSYLGYKAWTVEHSISSLQTQALFAAVDGDEGKVRALALQIGYRVIDKHFKGLAIEATDDLALHYAQEITKQKVNEFRQCGDTVQQKWVGIMGYEWVDLPKCEHTDAR